MHRWQQANGKRHVGNLPRMPKTGTEFTALCGVEVTVGIKDDLNLGALWLDGTCLGCEAAFRLILESVEAR